MGLLDLITSVVKGAPVGMPIGLQNDIEMATSSLAKLYSINNNYIEVFGNAYVNIIKVIDRRETMQEPNMMYYKGIYTLIQSGGMRNMTDMVLLYLYVTVFQPDQVSLTNVYNKCAEYVAKKLIQHGVPPKWTIGNHSDMTEELLEVIDDEGIEQLTSVDYLNIFLGNWDKVSVLNDE